MGDISELRGLIVAIVFLGTFSFLVVMIPSQFLVSSQEYARNIPPQFSAFDLQYYTETYNQTVGTGGVFEWTAGGWDWYSVQGFDYFALSVKEYWWVFWINNIPMHFKDTSGVDQGTVLTAMILDNAYAGSEQSLKYTCQNPERPELSCTLFFGFNTTKYLVPSTAWENGELYMLQAFGFDQMNSSVNAWNLIGAVLFFQMPEIHPVLNVLIALPIWITIAYISYILILRAIGAVFGGGGA